MRTIILLLFLPAVASAQLTPFEISGGKRSATYQEVTDFYKTLTKRTKKVRLESGLSGSATDVPFHPFQIVTLSNKRYNARTNGPDGKTVLILINNGIHAGEPDGIDASMMLARDVADGKLLLPDNVVLAIIPVYNVGGALNRNSTTRVNQNGPEEYGFRGNANNYDLNRDYTKMDATETQGFTINYHNLQPDLFLDNHVSDGADYQHTMTLISTQYDKLGGAQGKWLREIFDPALYAGMKANGSAMIPYIDFGNNDIRRSGVTMFNETPRYATGYTALFGTLGFVAETHMLKPYDQRVKATYDLMTIFIEQASKYSKEILALHKSKAAEIAAARSFPLRFIPDTTKSSQFEFMGYNTDSFVSEVTGLPRIRFNREKPFTATLNYYNYYKGDRVREKPKAYVISGAQKNTLHRLHINHVRFEELTKDRAMEVVAYRITDYKSSTTPYEGHHRNSGVKFNREKTTVQLHKGDIIVPMGYFTDRYVVEMLEPDGDDSFFSWGFYDTYLQQKEGYSDYRWEDEAVKVLRENDSLRVAFEDKKKTDKAFAASSSQMLYWIYQNSKWREKEYMRYPIFRIE